MSILGIVALSAVLFIVLAYVFLFSLCRAASMGDHISAHLRDDETAQDIEPKDSNQ